MPEVIIIPIVFICLTYMIVSIGRVIQRSRRDSRMAEVTSKLVDRLGAGPDLVNFINSDAYRNLLAGETAAEKGISARILNSLQAGAVLSAAGAALLGTADWIPRQNGKTAAGIIGSLLLAVGMALVLSALWSNWLMKRWNVTSEQ